LHPAKTIGDIPSNVPGPRAVPEKCAGLQVVHGVREVGGSDSLGVVGKGVASRASEMRKGELKEQPNRSIGIKKMMTPRGQEPATKE